MGHRGTKLVITERQQEILQEMTVSRVCPQGLAQRAAMILGVFEGDQNGVIAQRLGCERHAGAGDGVGRRRLRNSSTPNAWDGPGNFGGQSKPCWGMPRGRDADAASNPTRWR